MHAPLKRIRPGVGRRFYTTLFVLSTLATLSFLAHLPEDVSAPRLAGRSLDKEQLECRLVYQFHDKCAFVRANCADEEAGLISYLQFYYCSFRHVQPVAFVILMAWMGLLFSTIGIAASDFLCINLGTIADILGMSESLTGVTFLAFGNGSPDVFSTFAAMRSHSGSLAVGELIGAASFITAVVAGSMAMVRPFEVARTSFVRDIGFFVVAACFSMLFLADGRLQMWECACMVAFYVFYVVFVVTWHWWLTRRRHPRGRETVAKLRHHITRTPELSIVDEAHQTDEEVAATETTGLLQVAGQDDVGSLEGNFRPLWKRQEDLDEDNEDPDRQLATLRSSMRLTRPARGERRNTPNPIRPSLVGALEFRSVLHSLEKRSTRVSPINLRRYSDDPSTPLPFTPRPTGSISQPRSPLTDMYAQYDVNRRARAVSANDAVGLRLETPGLHGHDLMSESTPELGSSPAQGSFEGPGHSRLAPVFGSPRLFVSPPESSQPSRDHSPAPPRSMSPDHLAPPGTSLPTPYHDDEQRRGASLKTTPSPSVSPNLGIPRIATHHPPSFQSSPSSEFPPYTDIPIYKTTTSSGPPSIQLPPPSLSPESSRNLSIVAEQYREDEEGEADLLRIFKWWPYRYLPPPQVLGRTLLPTIYTWNGKSMWDKLLGIVAVPSVLLLTITLPIVETEEKQLPLQDVSGLLSPRDDSYSRSGTLAQSSSDSPDLNGQHVSHMAAQPHKQASSCSNTLPPTTSSNDQTSEPQEWNRWLVCLQLFTAPLFTIAIAWANLDIDHNFRSFVWYILCSILFSLVCLLILLGTTTVDHPPTFRPLFCFLGFAVAIAWISTIANEVVGVLKAFGVILGISDAILGLTIFAVGNSLGDLVADITVAKLGFPVMALSACFGGPMLNILLGIGVSGLYITIRHSAKHHHHHPDGPMEYKPYPIHVSTTLLISGITLLVTLMGLLIVVPLNGWKMDRKIGLGLIGLWSLSTLGNVAVEVLGWGSRLGVS